MVDEVRTRKGAAAGAGPCRVSGEHAGRGASRACAAARAPPCSIWPRGRPGPHRPSTRRPGGTMAALRRSRICNAKTRRPRPAKTRSWLATRGRSGPAEAADGRRARTGRFAGPHAVREGQGAAPRSRVSGTSGPRRTAAGWSPHDEHAARHRVRRRRETVGAGPPAGGRVGLKSRFLQAGGPALPGWRGQGRLRAALMLDARLHRAAGAAPRPAPAPLTRMPSQSWGGAGRRGPPGAGDPTVYQRAVCRAPECRRYRCQG